MRHLCAHGIVRCETLTPQIAHFTQVSDPTKDELQASGSPACLRIAAKLLKLFATSVPQVHCDIVLSWAMGHTILLMHVPDRTHLQGVKTTADPEDVKGKVVP